MVITGVGSGQIRVQAGDFAGDGGQVVLLGRTFSTLSDLACILSPMGPVIAANGSKERI